MREQIRFPRLAWIPLFTGAAWLWTGLQGGTIAFLLLFPIGGLLLAGGVAQLLWAGDRRITQTTTLVGMLALVTTPALALGFGGPPALFLGALVAATILAAGALSMAQEPWVEGVPQPKPSWRLAARVALDEWVLGMEQLSIGMPMGEAADRLVGEVDAAQNLYRERGWLADPESFHLDPPEIEAIRIRPGRSGLLDYEHLSFESLYEPHAEEPGRDRWLGYEPNRTAHAYLLRHDEGDRPWLVCTNGYRMGLPAIDLRAFGHYHKALGLNVLVPVLPLHGLRRIGRKSGDGFLTGDVLDTIHAEAQAVWDIRRMIAWVRGQGAPAVGITGLSLGGYTTALLAGIESGLACAILGIPVADLARTFWRHGPPLQLEYLERRGVGRDRVAEVLRVISPLAVECKVPTTGRMLFGGVADRLVTPDHVRDLSEHWGNPPTVWYQGGHLSFRMDRRIQQEADKILRATGLAI